MLGPEPSYEVTLDFPLPERQRLALYLVRHLGGVNVAPELEIFSSFANSPEITLISGLQVTQIPLEYP
jgi:hypothetical protein